MNLTMTRIVGGALALSFAACTEEGSVGVYPESSSGAEDDGSTDDGGSTTGTASATDTSADATADGTTESGDATTATVDDDAGSSSESGTVGMCARPGNCVEYSPCEGGNCGELESLFDANGCVRQECQDHDACADDERCYRAIEFGGCAPSGVFCEDDVKTEACLCGSLPECGGGFCVPEALYPASSPLPQGVVFGQATCAPDDGAAVYFQWGGFGACDLDERLLEITVFEGPLEVGTFEFSGSPEGFGWYVASDESVVEVVTATIEITAFDGVAFSGTVEATLAPNADGISVLAGDLVDVPFCEGGDICG